MMRQSVLLTLLCLIPLSCAGSPDIPIRTAYSVSPVHCHISEAFERRGILQKHGLKPLARYFIRGDEQGWEIRAGRIDAAFSCEVPAILLLADNPDMKIIATAGTLGRVAVLVPESSGIRDFADLKGRSIALAHGSNAHKDVLLWMQGFGLLPGDDVRMVYLDESKMGDALKGSIVDAVATWDPWVEIYARRFNMRVLRQRPLRSYIMVSDKYATRVPTGVRNYLESVKEAISWIRRHKPLADRWAAERSGFPEEVIRVISVRNGNFKVRRGAVDICLCREDVGTLEECAAFLKSLGMVDKDFKVEDHIDFNYCRSPG